MEWIYFYNGALISYHRYFCSSRMKLESLLIFLVLYLLVPGLECKDLSSFMVRKRFSTARARYGARDRGRAKEALQWRLGDIDPEGAQLGERRQEVVSADADERGYRDTEKEAAHW